MSRIRAVKVLTAWATFSNNLGDLHELAALGWTSRITQRNPSVHLPVLLDKFRISGPHGDHLCLVLPAASISVDQFRRSRPEAPRFHPHLVRFIIVQVLEALHKLHEYGIIHTGKMLPVWLYIE